MDEETQTEVYFTNIVNPELASPSSEAATKKQFPRFDTNRQKSRFTQGDNTKYILLTSVILSVLPSPLAII